MSGSSKPDDSRRQMLLHADDIDPSYGFFKGIGCLCNDKEPGTQTTSSQQSMRETEGSANNALRDQLLLLKIKVIVFARKWKCIQLAG